MTAELVQPSAKRRHSWGAPVSIHGSETSSGCEQTERTCKLCGIVRITVHPPKGDAWPEWRHPSSKIQFALPQTPPCTGAEDASA